MGCCFLDILSLVLKSVSSHFIFPAILGVTDKELNSREV